MATPWSISVDRAKIKEPVTGTAAPTGGKSVELRLELEHFNSKLEAIMAVEELVDHLKRGKFTAAL